MRRFAGALFRQMKPVQAIGQRRIVRGQKNKPAGPGAQCFRQRAAASGIARAHNHHAVPGQAARRGERIGEPLIVSEKNQQPRVEAAEVSC